MKTVTHEDVTQEQLGGAKAHTSKSGVAHLAADNDIELLRIAREFYSFLPLNNESGVPHRATHDPRDRKPMGLDTLVPLDANTPYDIRQVIEVQKHLFSLQTLPSSSSFSSSSSALGSQFACGAVVGGWW